MEQGLEVEGGIQESLIRHQNKEEEYRWGRGISDVKGSIVAQKDRMKWSERDS